MDNVSVCKEKQQNINYIYTNNIEDRRAVATFKHVILTD